MLGAVLTSATLQGATQYSARFIAWQVRSPVINNKGQVAGIEDKGTEQVLHLWLPEEDYGLEAGPHAFPFPFNIGKTQLIDFSDTGSLLFGWPGTDGLTLYFSVTEGVFHSLEDLIGLPIYEVGGPGQRRFVYRKTQGIQIRSRHRAVGVFQAT
jgi:hypothetical protein